MGNFGKNSYFYGVIMAIMSYNWNCYAFWRMRHGPKGMRMNGASNIAKKGLDKKCYLKFLWISLKLKLIGYLDTGI